MSENQHHAEGHSILKFIINGNTFEWHKEYITGAEIRELGKIPNDEEIFLSIKEPWDDEVISEEKQVNLARPEIEHFFSKKKQVKFTIVVNGRQKHWIESTISFEQVIVLAFGVYDPNPDKVYTVTYDMGPHENKEGSMVRGTKVIVKNNMVFNVTATDKS